MFIAVDCATFLLRLWNYGYATETRGFLGTLRRFLKFGKTRSLDGMSEKELRGWDLYLEGKQSSVGFLTMLIMYPLTLQENTGLQMLNQCLFSQGLESFLYVAAIFLVDIGQDTMASNVVMNKTGIRSFSRYYGRAFTEQTLCTALPAATATMWVGGNLAQLGFTSQKLKLGPFAN